MICSSLWQLDISEYNWLLWCSCNQHADRAFHIVWPHSSHEKDDMSFAELLNWLKEGNCTENDIETLKRSVLTIKPGHLNYPIHANHLFTTNELVNSHNNAVFHNTPTDKTQVKCIDLTVGDISDDLKKTMREKIPDDPVKIVHLHILKFRLLFFIVSLWSAYSRYDFWYYTRLLVSFCVDQSSVGT